MKKNFWICCLIFLVSGCEQIPPPFGSVTPPLIEYPKHSSPPPKASPYADYVLVEKSKNKMYLVKNGKALRSYNISLGGNPRGHKQQEGDMRTPEGLYMLTYKNFDSKFYKSLMIDYPNEQDIARAQARGVPPGGEIVIHGMPNAKGNYLGPLNPVNWTQGCVAVRNHEMDEIFSLLSIPTPIEIRP